MSLQHHDLETLTEAADTKSLSHPHPLSSPSRPLYTRQHSLVDSHAGWTHSLKLPSQKCKQHFCLKTHVTLCDLSFTSFLLTPSPSFDEALLTREQRSPSFTLLESRSYGKSITSPLSILSSQLYRLSISNDTRSSSSSSLLKRALPLCLDFSGARRS